jgi:hypothetical protein
VAAARIVQQPVSRAGAAAVIFIWVLSFALVAYWAYRAFGLKLYREP